MTNEQSNVYAWFVVLEGARNTHNLDLIAKAKGELLKLGVEVSYRQPAAQANEPAAETTRVQEIPK